MYGFLSEEMRDASGARAGFTLCNIENNKSIVMAKKNSGGGAKIGPYSVNCRQTAELMVESLQNKSGKKVAVMDEIGKMEMVSLRDKANYLLEKEFFKCFDKADHIIGKQMLKID